MFVLTFFSSNLIIRSTHPTSPPPKKKPIICSGSINNTALLFNFFSLYWEGGGHIFGKSLVHMYIMSIHRIGARYVMILYTCITTCNNIINDNSYPKLKTTYTNMTWYWNLSWGRFAHVRRVRRALYVHVALILFDQEKLRVNSTRKKSTMLDEIE